MIVECRLVVVSSSYVETLYDRTIKKCMLVCAVYCVKQCFYHPSHTGKYGHLITSKELFIP